MTPTQRTMKYLKTQGFKTGIVEKWIPQPDHPGGGFRKDLFGIIDVIALTSEGVLGVQSTGTDFAGHYRKIVTDKHMEATAWLKTPGTKLLLIGWRKVKKKRGGKLMIYQPRIHEFKIEDFSEVPNDSHVPSDKKQLSR